jgi:membrane protein DedA with SNARE-associated domain
MVLLVPASTGDGLTGLSGLVADVIAALGAWGVGLLTLVETVFPPIPSEIVLPLAGFLAQQGRMGLVSVLLAATVGSVAGATLLYAAGARLGADRAGRLLCRLPRMEASDVQHAQDWFDRHGRSAVFFGRLVPGVRSLISLPAGARRMPLHTFVLFTTAGSALWNSVLVGAGVALGTQWQRVEGYADVFDKVVIAVLVAAVGWAVARRLRRRRRAGASPGRDRPGRDH